MANSTYTAAGANVGLFSTIYLVEGSILLGSNGLLLAVILKYEALRQRKEFIIIGGLALADACSGGLGNTAAGMYRIPKALDGTFTDGQNRLSCFLTFHNMIWIFSIPCSALMLLVLSIDLFIAVKWPFRYLKLNKTYAFKLVSPVYLLCLCETIIILYRVWSRNATDVTKVCYVAQAMLPSDYKLFWAQNTAAAMLSIALYFLVWVISKRNLNKVLASSSSDHKNQLTWQNRLTAAVAITSLCTFVFYGIPTVTMNILSSTPALYNSLIGWVWVVTCINPIANIVIYATKQADIQKGIKSFFKCKDMPVTLDLWHVTRGTTKVRYTIKTLPAMARTKKKFWYGRPHIRRTYMVADWSYVFLFYQNFPLLLCYYYYLIVCETRKTKC